MVKYIIFDNKLKAMQVSYDACVQTSGRVSFKWTYYQNNDATKSCLMLKYQADYTDISGGMIHPKCDYNEFIDKYKNIIYTVVDNLDETWSNI